MKVWNGVNFNTDFEPIDAYGNIIGPKDMAASEGWTAQNEPWRSSPGWHAQPLSAEQERGIQQTNPQGYAERMAWRSANPTNALGAGAWQRSASSGPQRISAMPPPAPPAVYQYPEPQAGTPSGADNPPLWGAAFDDAPAFPRRKS